MKFQNKYFFIPFCFFIFFWGWSALAVSVGSKRAASQQKRTFLRAAYDDNELCGFAAFESGITLQDCETVCSFNAFFPVSGDIVLNGGTLNLLRDLYIKKPFSISSS